MKEILVLVTNQTTVGATKEKNGTFAPELTHAVHQSMHADMAFDTASLKGDIAPLCSATP